MRLLQIGFNLKEPLRGELASFLRQNLDIFAWIAYDVPDISPMVMSHWLNIHPEYRSMGEKEEMLRDRPAKGSRRGGKQSSGGWIHPGDHLPKWLSHVVMVKKSNRK